MIVLVIIAIVSGVITSWLILRVADVSALRTVGKRIHAHLLEFRLFFDEPGLIWRAQVALIWDNVRLLRLLLPPTLILAVPMTWLFLQLEAVYGSRPLRLGETAVVTAQLMGPIEGSDRFDLGDAGGIRVETPPVRVVGERQVSWRIRAAGGVEGRLMVTVNGRVVTKSVATGDTFRVLSRRRWRSVAEFLLHPEEPRLPDGDVAWVEVGYPERDGGWIAWFVGISAGAAVATGWWMGKGVSG